MREDETRHECCRARPRVILDGKVRAIVAEQKIVGDVTSEPQYTASKEAEVILLSPAQYAEAGKPKKAKKMPDGRWAVTHKARRRAVRLPGAFLLTTPGGDVQPRDAVTVQAEEMASILGFDAERTAAFVGRFPIDGTDAGPSADDVKALVTETFSAVNAFRGHLNLGKASVKRAILA